jgi:glycosyltransferase involved in cell wall biosynthesis
MIKPKLSIVMPALRIERWQGVYNSIQIDPSLWELIIVAPYEQPLNLLSGKNIKYIKDFGSPMRASCIGANLAEGKYLTWIADDGTVFTKTVENALKILDNDINGRLVVVTKYLEACTEVHPDSYYKLNNAYPRSPYIPDDWWIFNTAFMHREYYDYLGGWDSIFEACPLGHADLAARAQRDGCTTVMLPEPLLNCDHMPGTSGDHGPVCLAHTEHDDPLYAKIYNDPNCVNRTTININNWKNAPMKWTRRFA